MSRCTKIWDGLVRPTWWLLERAELVRVWTSSATDVWTEAYTARPGLYPVVEQVLLVAWQSFSCTI